MRASHMQSNVVCLSLLGAEREAQVRAACSDVITKIDASLRTSWLPIEFDVALSQSVFEVCGSEGAAEWARQAIYQSTRGPLMGPIIDGLTRLGLGPKHGLRRLPAGWDLVYRNCGSLTCDAQPRSAVLILRDAPKEVLGQTYIHGVGAAFEAVICVLNGTVMHSTLNVRAGEARFELKWSLAGDA